jgi:hypothetical protein
MVVVVYRLWHHMVVSPFLQNCSSPTQRKSVQPTQKTTTLKTLNLVATDQAPNVMV